MKILKLHIKKLRGIVDLSINLDGYNAVIFGPNGVGKSAVVDAIDFLLTGDITRLKGIATGNVTTEKHGPHIGCSSNEAEVSAEIQSVNLKTFTVTRCMDNKDNVDISDDTCRDDFVAMTTNAKSGAHFLSRRELLRYVLVTPGDRSKQIQTLLNITDLKATRDALLKLKKQIDTAVKSAEAKYSSNKSILFSTLNISSKDELLSKVNELRLVLGGEQINELPCNNDFIVGITYADNKQARAVANTSINISNAINYFNSAKSLLQTAINTTTKTIELIAEKGGSSRNIALASLLQAGLQLIDSTAKCPLCLAQWEKEAILIDFLTERSRRNETINQFINTLNDDIIILKSTILDHKTKLESFASHIKDDVLKKFPNTIYDKLNAE